ncbi:MAG: hypothetical protein LBB66_01990, partial [Desulfovibrio sp.]|nr:hypothetical protein [Desulfovibrio sp.]
MPRNKLGIGDPLIIAIFEDLNKKTFQPGDRIPWSGTRRLVHQIIGVELLAYSAGGRPAAA